MCVQVQSHRVVGWAASSSRRRPHQQREAKYWHYEWDLPAADESERLAPCSLSVL
jgi:hypothetical protein